MPISLDPVEARILGSLIEKSKTTPDQYPLTFNALISACNQKTSRDPVMSLDANVVGKGVQGLIEKNLLERREIPGSRVPKFYHHVENLLSLASEKEIGALCVLLLRGPQTPGEIKGRTDRLCTFESTVEVEGVLQGLAAREDGPFVARLPRAPGQKETRFRHCFGEPAAPGEFDETASAPVGASTSSARSASTDAERIAALEKRVEELERLVKDLTAQAAAGLER
jgi:uncharacterized protein YceH (UPF0502 family)